MTAVDVVDYDSVAPRVNEILRRMLGENAAIELSPGFEGRVRIKVVSPCFNGMDESEKSGVVWNALNSELKDDANKISFVIAYSTDEL